MNNGFEHLLRACGFRGSLIGAVFFRDGALRWRTPSRRGWKDRGICTDPRLASHKPANYFPKPRESAQFLRPLPVPLSGSPAFFCTLWLRGFCLRSGQSSLTARFRRGVKIF